MASLSRIISSSTLRTAGGFAEGDTSTLLIVDSNNKFPQRVRYYTSEAGLLADGFVAADPVVRIAKLAFSQQPRVSRIGVGRRAGLVDIDYQCVPVVLNSTVYQLKLLGPTGVAGTASFTSDATATLTEICAGLSAAVTALAIPGLTVTDQATSVRVKSTVANQWFAVQCDFPDRINVFQAQSGGTLATDLAADMAAIVADKRDWVAFTLTTSSEAELLAAAAWAESSNKLFAAQSSDLRPANGDVGNVLKALKALNYQNSSFHSHHAPSEFAGAALFTRCLARPIGSVNFALQTLAGVSGTPYSETQLTNLDSDRGNYYTTYDVDPNTNQTVSLSNTGQTLAEISGAKIYIDTVRDAQALESSVRGETLRILTTHPRVSYNQRGQDRILSGPKRSARIYEANGVLTEGSSSVTALSLDLLPPGDRAIRRMPGFVLRGELAGAVNSVGIEIILAG